MGYYNPILSYGVKRFVVDAADAGVDGVIVPDLPPEEAGELEKACQASQVALVYLVAPTSSPDRIDLIASHASGFIYLVSVTGVTGARDQLSPGLEELISRVRNTTSLPIAVGFGISTPAQAKDLCGLVEGVIVGSALIQAVSQSECPSETAASFIRSFREQV